jgi:hypothetical protein
MEDTRAKDNISGSIVAVNRTYKVIFFRSLLLSDISFLRCLFQEITKTSILVDFNIAINTINTIDDVFIRTYRNDFSFTIGNQALILLEQQFTINSNLPTFFLLIIHLLILIILKIINFMTYTTLV